MRFIRFAALSALVVAASMLLNSQAFAQPSLNSCKAQVSGEVAHYLREVAGLSESTPLELVSVKEVSAGATVSGDWNESYQVDLKIDGFPYTYIAHMNSDCSLLSLAKPVKKSLYKATVRTNFCETYEPDCDRL